MIFRRRARRFTELIDRQLDLFAAEEAGFLRDIDAAERAYDNAERGEGEARYGDYVDLVEIGVELLGGIRDAYAATLEEEAAAEYELAFNLAVARRFPRFGLEIGDV